MRKNISYKVLLGSLFPALLPLVLFLGSGLTSTIYESLGFLSASPAAPSLAAYRSVFEDARLLDGVLFGLYLSFVSSFLAVAGGTALALLLNPARRLRRWGLALAHLPVALPHIVAVIVLSQFFSGTSLPLRAAWHLGLTDAQGDGLLHVLPGLGAILVYVWKGLPFVFITVSGRLMNMDALLLDAARGLGANACQAVCHITIPLLKKTLWGSFVVLTAFSFCSFEVPFLIGPTTPRTLPVVIFALYGGSGLEARASAMAASVVLLLLSALLFGLYHRATRES